MMMLNRYRVVVLMAGLFLLAQAGLAQNVLPQPQQQGQIQMQIQVMPVQVAPAAQTQPADAGAQPADLPTFIAQIFTLSVQDDQLAADVHWKPQGQQTLKLLDLPGDTMVMLGGAGNNRAISGGDALFIHNLQSSDTAVDRYNIMIRPGMISIGHMHMTGMGKMPNAPGAQVRFGGATTNDSVQLGCNKGGVTLNISKVANGQVTRVPVITEPTWASFVEKHPNEIEESVRPLLENLHLESVLVGRDLWAYQVLADALKPAPEMDAQVKPLIQQFDDAAPEKRDEASTKLKALGTPAYAVLAHLDRKQLSPEQNERLASIARCGFLDDEKVAAFRTDKKFLLDAMASKDDAVRRAAAAQLKTVLGQAVDFDPAAPANQRSVQLATIRQQILPPPTTQPAAELQPAQPMPNMVRHGGPIKVPIEPGN